ncbi:MAG: 3-oxoacyl-ACP synthase [Deltaproteobacteria bacterium]|nr:3-oxoacyl-ACP synthase [Deltaproteobacteria bacterium]
MRIAITGLGAISALGTGMAAHEAALRSGRSGIGELDLFDTTDHKTHLAAQVRDLRPQDHLGARERRHCSRSDVLGMIAAREALADSSWPGRWRPRMGLYVGATTGGMLESETFLGRMRNDSTVRVPFGAMVSHPLSATADRIARLLDLTGPRVTVCSACSSGANAIGLAMRAIESGSIEVAIAGGADALCRLTYAGFNSLGAVDPQPCRPFDRRRAGLTLGEAGAMLVLEPLDVAQQRGIHVYAVLAGHASCSEAHHITNPLATGRGAARAMRLALEDAGVDAAAIDYVNAHGTGTRLNDAMETRALNDVLGERAAKIPVSSSKGQLGHTLGAAGAIEAVVTALALRGGFAPPTAGLEEPDPECDLDHVIGAARPHPIRFALSTSFGFGGNDAALVLAAPGEAPERRPATRRSVVVTGVSALVPERPGVLAFEPRGRLDPARARRLDRVSKVGCVAVGDALAQACLSSPADRERTGLVLGSGFGALEESTAFLERLFSMGPRLAPPADFPNLVLSAQAAHASIYHGLQGPHSTIAALGASGDLAIAAAWDEVASGRLASCVAGAIELSAPLLGAALGMRTTVGTRDPHSEGAGAIVLEDETRARARGATPRASLLAFCVKGEPEHGRGDQMKLCANAMAEALLGMGADLESVRAVVASCRRPLVQAALDLIFPPGHAISLQVLSEELGYHEALGALVAKTAIERVGSAGGLVLALGLAPGLATCLVFGPV